MSSLDVDSYHAIYNVLDLPPVDSPRYLSSPSCEGSTVHDQTTRDDISDQSMFISCDRAIESFLQDVERTVNVGQSVIFDTRSEVRYEIADETSQARQPEQVSNAGKKIQKCKLSEKGGIVAPPRQSAPLDTNAIPDDSVFHPEDDAGRTIQNITASPKGQTSGAVKKHEEWKIKLEAKKIPKHKQLTRPRFRHSMIQDARWGQSAKNILLADFFVRSRDRGLLSKLEFAPEGMPCAYAGITKIQVNPTRKLEFAKELFSADLFDFKVDWNAFEGGDPCLGLDMEERARHKAEQEEYKKQGLKAKTVSGFQGRDFKALQNALGGTCKNCFGLKVIDPSNKDRRTLLWRGGIHGEFPLISLAEELAVPRKGMKAAPKKTSKAPTRGIKKR